MIFNHVKKLKQEGKRIGITFSTFDLLHAGHIAMLSEAKNHCDYLICGLQTDPTIDRPETKNKPIQSIVERQIQLAACRYVDEILIYETEFDLLQLIMTQKMHIRFLGDEYKTRDFTGKQYCIDHGIEIYYHLRRHRYSSSEIRNRVYLLEKEKREDSLKELYRVLKKEGVALITVWISWVVFSNAAVIVPIALAPVKSTKLPSSAAQPVMVTVTVLEPLVVVVTKLVV